MSCTGGSGNQKMSRRIPEIKNVYVRRRRRAPVLNETKTIGENGNLPQNENQPASVSKDEILKQKNSEESSVLSTYAHQNLDAAKSEEKLIDENVDMQTLSTDQKQSGAVASHILPQELADMDEELVKNLEAPRTQRTTIDIIEASSEEQKDSAQSDLVSDVKVEIQKLQASVSSELISTKQYESTNFQVGIFNRISGRLDQYSDVLTDLSKRVTKIENNQVKLMCDIADIKIMLLALVPQEKEFPLPSSTQQEEIKIDDVKKREKGKGTENEQKTVDDAIELVAQASAGIMIQAEAGKKSQYEQRFAAGQGLKGLSSGSKPFILSSSSKPDILSSSSPPVILTSAQLTSANPTACEGIKDKGKGVVVEESRKKNAYVPSPNVPKFWGDAQETGGYINPVEMVTTIGEKKLAYHTTKEFVANDAEIARKLHEEEVVSQQREQEKWEISKGEKRRKSKLMRKSKKKGERSRNRN